MLAGLIWAIPARLSNGIAIALAPELNSPKYPIVVGSWTAKRAFAVVWLGSQPSLWAVESSSALNAIRSEPTRPWTCASASRAPLRAACAPAAEAPRSGPLK